MPKVTGRSEGADDDNRSEPTVSRSESGMAMLKANRPSAMRVLSMAVTWL